MNTYIYIYRFSESWNKFFNVEMRDISGEGSERDFGFPKTEVSRSIETSVEVSRQTKV